MVLAVVCGDLLPMVAHVVELGPRPVPEWIGKTPLSRIPRDTKDRILRRFNDRCADCSRPFCPSLKPQFDHRPPLILGGENRESKIEPVCPECHRGRTHTDRRVKAASDRMRAKFMSIDTPSKHPIPGGKRTKWKKKYNRKTGRFETVRRKKQPMEGLPKW